MGSLAVPRSLGHALHSIQGLTPLCAQPDEPESWAFSASDSEQCESEGDERSNLAHGSGFMMKENADIHEDRAPQYAASTSRCSPRSNVPDGDSRHSERNCTASAATREVAPTDEEASPRAEDSAPRLQRPSEPALSRTAISAVVATAKEKGEPPRAKRRLDTSARSTPTATAFHGDGGGRGDYECFECGKLFTKPCKLARHATTHTGEKPFACSEEGCSKAFATKDKLKRHALSHTRRKAGLSFSVGDAARREAELREQVVREPPSRVPAAPGHQHLRYLQPTLVETLVEKESAHKAASSEDKVRGAGGWKHFCEVCGRSFLDNYHLKRHVKAIHEGPRPYKCDQPVPVEVEALPIPDGRSLALPGPLTEREVADRDSRELGSSCATSEKQVVRACGAAFAKKWQLRDHLHSEHGCTRYNSRQHRCPHPGCGRAFDRPSKLAAHGKSHTARFRCQFEGCDKAFVLASGLNLHVKQGHPFRCGICEMVFNREEHMLSHQGTHKVAGDGGYVRPYPCHVPGCGRAFTEKRNLYAHRRTQHTEGGRKRFRCEVDGCSMAFAHRQTLTKHVKREHAPGPGRLFEEVRQDRTSAADTQGASEAAGPSASPEGCVNVATAAGPQDGCGEEARAAPPRIAGTGSCDPEADV